MFIENPNKKETYSFRVKPDLLERIKNYAKATNQTVPEILNEMIDEKTKGLHLTNDYLENTIATTNIIGLPPLEDIYNKGKYKEFGLFFESQNRLLYEVQQVPNNLDIWTDTKGYTSDERGADHEGISFVLAPDLITKPEYLETPELLFCCLVPIYFKISVKKQTIQAKNISFTKALDKIRASPNMDLLDEFTKSTELVKFIIHSYYNKFKTATENPDGTFTAGEYKYSNRNQLLLDIYNKLLIELNEATIQVNINVINHYDKAIERQQGKQYGTELGADSTINDLREENRALKDMLKENQAKSKELEERANELETEISTLKDITNKYNDILKKLDKLETINLTEEFVEDSNNTE